MVGLGSLWSYLVTATTVQTHCDYHTVHGLQDICMRRGAGLEFWEAYAAMAFLMVARLHCTSNGSLHLATHSSNHTKHTVSPYSPHSPCSAPTLAQREVHA